MISVFISRELGPSSDFKRILEERQIKVYGNSLIDCCPLPFGDLPEVDWIFFYSRNAVRYFFEGLDQVLPPNIRLATMGTGTASTLEEYALKAHFIGNGTPSTTAVAFLQVAKQNRVLFPRAQVSKKSIQQLLVGAIEIKELIVYSNKPKPFFQLPFCDYLVFTSPLNAQAYFDKKQFVIGQKIIAIGKTTETALKKIGLSEVIIAKKPSELAMAFAVLSQIS